MGTPGGDAFAEPFFGARGIRRAEFSTVLVPPLVQPVIDVAVKYKLIPKPLAATTLITNPT